MKRSSTQSKMKHECSFSLLCANLICRGTQGIQYMSKENGINSSWVLTMETS